MNVAVYLSPIRGKIDSCEQKQELWNSDHQRTTRALDLEDLLGDVVECYDEIQKFDSYVDGQIRSGEFEYDDELEQSLVSLCGRVHRLLEALDAGLLPWFEQRFDSLDSAVELRDRLERARESERFGYRRNAHRKNQKDAKRLVNLFEEKYPTDPSATGSTR